MKINLNGTPKGSEHTFMSGVIILTVSTVIVKIIGLAYKIPLLSILGPGGMGYFNSAYEIYALLCGVSTSGLPIAVSMLISSANERGDIGGARRIFATSSAILLTKGVLFSAALALAAQPIAELIGNKEAYYAILAISPSLLFSCISSACRGYFQGCRQMLPTAASQLIEAVCKLLLGVTFAYLGIRMGMQLYSAAAMGILAVSFGSLFASAYLCIKLRRDSRLSLFGSGSGESGKGYYLGQLLCISLPITLGSVLMGSSRIIDMSLIMRRLQDIGVSVSEANEIYGSYTTLAFPVFSLVPAFIPPITESLIPRLSAAVERNDREEQTRAISNATRLTLFISMPASMGIMLYSEEIITLLFRGQSEAISISAPLLSVLGVAVLFSCMISTANAVLQSYKKVMLPIFALLVGAVVKAVSAYFLIGDADVGALGAPISTVLFNVTVVVLDLIFVRRTAKKTGLAASLVKPFVASGVAVLTSYALYMPLLAATDNVYLSFGTAFIVAAALYLALSIALGVVSKDDIAVFYRKKRKRL